MNNSPLIFESGLSTYPYPNDSALNTQHSALSTQHYEVSTMKQLEAEIMAICAQIESLQQERATLTTNNVLAPTDSSPQALAEAYRQQARDMVKISAEIKGIDDAIAALKLQLRQKESQLGYKSLSRHESLQEQVEVGKNQAKIHADRVNELAAELATELKTLKAIADQLSPSYWQVYYKPFITGFKTISVPHVRSDGDVWTIVNRVV